MEKKGHEERDEELRDCLISSLNLLILLTLVRFLPFYGDNVGAEKANIVRHDFPIDIFG